MSTPEGSTKVESKNTIAFMARVGKKISLPGDLYEMITAKGKNVLCIIPNDIKKIVLFPTNAESGLYAKINLRRENRLDDSFFLALREQLVKFKVNTLFTTGVCMEHVDCYWEGVLEYNDDFPLEDFKKAILSIQNVVSVRFNILKP